MKISFSLSTRLEHQHESLADSLNELPDEQIRRQIILGKWSIFENIVHLQTYQHTFLQRIERILAENNPSFPRYTAEADPEFLDNCERPTREIIRDLENTRKEMAFILLSLSTDALDRTGTHPVFGKMTVLQWLNFFLLHEAHHLFTVFKLGAELRKTAGF